MTRSIPLQLALKDLYMARWTLLASVAAGVVSIAIAPLSPAAFYVGAVSFVCVLIVLNIFVVMSGVLQERQEKRLPFLLSLPVSTTEYWVVKMVTNLAMFLLPWVFLNAAAVLAIALTDIPNGLIPFMIATSAYILCYYSVLLGVAITTASLAWTTTVIVAGNVSVNFFIPLVFRLPSGGPNVEGEKAVWAPDIVTTLLIEAAFCVVVLAIAAIVQSRKRDFV
jgi:hypothetical protein